MSYGGVGRQLVAGLVCLLSHEGEVGVLVLEGCRYHLLDGLVGFGDEVGGFGEGKPSIVLILA